MSNIQVIQQMYEAFGKGDIPAILNHLAEDVEWDIDAPDYGIPWMKPRKGRGNVGEFFSSLAALEFLKFIPKHFLEGSGMVAAIVEVEARVKATGRTFHDPYETHVWTLDSSGKVKRFRHVVDTHGMVSALR